MDDAAILKRMREAIASSRGYASFFGWAPNRDLEELGPVRELAEASAARGVPLFDSIRIRGRGNDPPDLEALDPSGARVAIEVTELVDGDAIKAFKAGRHYDWTEWNRPKFLAEMEQRLAAKAARQSKLKDPPYEGGYVVVVFTDEPMLNRETVQGYLDGHRFASLTEGVGAYLLLSYDPAIESYPYYVLHTAA